MHYAQKKPKIMRTEIHHSTTPWMPDSVSPCSDPEEIWYFVVLVYFNSVGLIHYISFTTERGHPFMTSTRRASGSGGRMWTGRGSSPMWTSTQMLVFLLKFHICNYLTVMQYTVGKNS